MCRKTWSIRATQKKTYNTYHVRSFVSASRSIINYKNIYISFFMSFCAVYMSRSYGLKPFNKSHWRSTTMFIWLNTKVAKWKKKNNQHQQRSKLIQKSAIRPHLNHSIWNEYFINNYLYLFAAHSKHNKYR